VCEKRGNTNGTNVVNKIVLHFGIGPIRLSPGFFSRWMTDEADLSVHQHLCGEGRGPGQEVGAGAEGIGALVREALRGHDVLVQDAVHHRHPGLLLGHRVTGRCGTAP